VSVAKEMNFFDHIEEMRWHLMRSIIFLLVATILIFAFNSTIFNDIIFGPLNVDFWSYRTLCQFFEDFCVKEIPVKLLNTEIGGQFSLLVKTSFTLGLMASVPYFLWEIWRFVAPALHKSERSYAQVLLGFGFLLFIIGILFGYFIIFPITFLFLFNFEVSSIIENKYSISNYFEMISDTVLYTGLMFELPIVAYFLSKIGVLSTEFLNTYRKHLYIVLLILAAAITPSPDVLSMMMVALPLFILFEISVLVVARVQKYRSIEE
jgi:sec-independent protein translocase protein TatC